jgi:hypothetical protein
VTCGPALPCAFDDLRGVDQGAVHVEEDGFASDLCHVFMVALFFVLVFFYGPLRDGFRCGPVWLLSGSGAEAPEHQRMDRVTRLKPCRCYSACFD